MNNPNTIKESSFPTDPYVKLARSAIRKYLRQGRVPKIPPNLPESMLTNRAGTFVSLHHRKSGKLRGCIGTIFPTRATVAEEIIANAISAATQDPRFPPVTEEELSNLEINVDVLSKPKLIKDTPDDDTLDANKVMPPSRWRDKLNPKKNGLIVSTIDGRRGLLLPDIPGVKTSKQQIQICCQKGGINAEEPIKLEIFTVKRHR